MRLELSAPQPEAVVRAIERLFVEPPKRVDPWWAAGLAESLLGGSDGPAAQDAWGGAGVVEP